MFPRLPVLLYHHVGHPIPTPFPEFTVGPERFSNHMHWLKTWEFTPISPIHWVAACRKERSLPRKPAMITFDDAYADLSEFAFPVLQELEFRATVFVPTAKVGAANDWDRGRGAPCMAVLSQEDIRYWHGKGIEFGCHSRHHVDLTNVEKDVLSDEVAGSLLELTAILDERVCSFAYPWGQYDACVEKAAVESFEIAFTTEEGLNNWNTNPYRMRRTMVQHDDGKVALYCRLQHGYYPLQYWRDRIRLRTRLKHALRRG